MPREVHSDAGSQQPSGPAAFPFHGVNGMDFAEVDCIMQLVMAPGRVVPVPARLSYRSWDPYSVHASFSVEGRASVSWLFARDLLAEGMVRPSGLGDVRIWPGNAGQPGLLCLELSSSDGRALLTVPTEVLTPRLGRTFYLVPAGSEEASGIRRRAFSRSRLRCRGPRAVLVDRDPPAHTSRASAADAGPACHATGHRAVPESDDVGRPRADERPSGPVAAHRGRGA
ncbi:SsgA family sporulation/cell division regulator [Streptomyces chartreusis]